MKTTRNTETLVRCLDDESKDLLAAILNSYLLDGHAHATRENISFFYPDAIEGVLKQAIAGDLLRLAGKQKANLILQTLERVVWDARKSIDPKNKVCGRTVRRSSFRFLPAGVGTSAKATRGLDQVDLEKVVCTKGGKGWVVELPGGETFSASNQPGAIKAIRSWAVSDLARRGAAGSIGHLIVEWRS